MNPRVVVNLSLITFLMKNLLCINGSMLKLIAGVIVIFFWVVLLYLKVKPAKTYTVNLMENPEGSGHICIPVTMNDSVHPFVFDTGASFNVIDSGLSRKIGLSADGTHFFEKIKRFTETVRSDSVAFTESKFSVGSLKTTGIFLLNGYKGLLLDDIELMQRTGAIMGMETIRNFNWLFNFADNTVTISKGKIKIPALQDDRILTLDFYDEGITCMNITIDGITIQNVSFDTGHGGAVMLFEKKKNVDIFFSKRDSDTLLANNKHPVLGLSSGSVGETFIIDTMQINDFTMQGLFAFMPNDYDKAYITANFIRRFRIMYFDSTNKKIHLHVSPSDSTRHHRRDLQNFSRALLKHFEENPGKSSEGIPQEIVDLW